MLKTVTLELTIKTQVQIRIDYCKGDGITPPSCELSLDWWDEDDIHRQLQAHINENQQEIMEE